MLSWQHYTNWYGGYDLLVIEISQMIVDTAFQSSFSSLPKEIWCWGALCNIQQLFCLNVTIHGSTRSNNHLWNKDKPVLLSMEDIFKVDAETTDVL